MTKREYAETKRAAKEAMTENGIYVPMTAMILLESGWTSDKVFDTEIKYCDYVMFEDKRTGTQYQCYYGPKHYNPDLDTLWAVVEYID